MEVIGRSVMGKCVGRTDRPEEMEGTDRSLINMRKIEEEHG